MRKNTIIASVLVGLVVLLMAAGFGYSVLTVYTLLDNHLKEVH